MNWLNLETKLLHAPEYIGADPISRATWLNLMLWCASQENGGRIVGADTWQDRRWQQTAGVTLKEVRGAAPLVTAVGDDLIVWGYPVDKERAVQAQRTAAQNNGRLGGRKPKSEPKLEPDLEPKSEPDSVHRSEPDSEPILESGREGKGKERNGSQRAVAPKPTLSQWLAHAATLNWPPDDATAAFDHYEACGWRIGSKPVLDWRAASRNCHRRYLSKTGLGPSTSSRRLPSMTFA